MENALTATRQLFPGIGRVAAGKSKAAITHYQRQKPAADRRFSCPRTGLVRYIPERNFFYEIFRSRKSEIQPVRDQRCLFRHLAT